MTELAECFQGLTQIRGKIECVNGTPVCRATHGVDYCNRCDNALCGGCASMSCTFDEQCGPGSVCNSYPNGKVCTAIGSPACRHKNGYCWPVKESVMASPPPGARNQDICI
jgi:hypothetical protein